MKTLFTLELETMRLEAARWLPEDQRVDGPEIVLLHEGLGCLELWKDFPQQLANHLHTTVSAYSRAGYGHSCSVELPRPLDYMQREADEVLGQVLVQLTADPYVLLGHSDGATIALAYAGRHQDNKLAGVIAIAPHVVTEDIAIAAIAKAKQSYLEGDLANRLARYHGSNLAAAFWGWNDAWLDPKFRNFSILDRLATIDVDILAIQGTEDRYGTTRQLNLIATTAPRVTTALIAKADHSPHLTHAHDVMSIVGSFWASAALHSPSTGSESQPSGAYDAL